MREKRRGGWRGALAALCAAAVLLGMGGSAMAASVERTVIPIGKAVGIKLFSDGVLVVGFSEIPTEAGQAQPAKDCGLQTGDVITHINSEEVDTIEQVQALLQDLEGERMSIRCMRGERQLQMTAQAAKCASDGSYKLGAWIRDSMAGIGTVTYYDPQTGAFGALGHGISDVDTAQLMPLQSGGIMGAQMVDVTKGERGAPGVLHGAFQTGMDIGVLGANTPSGVFGTLWDDGLAQGQQPVPVAHPSQVELGEAEILSNISGDNVEPYTVQITRLFSADDEDTRDLMLCVTDPRLLETTGGIVQGMSGSPILQNGRLVGAVTHVLLDDPTAGYGIFAENMLSAGE